jgi:hypothetical protein
MEWLSNLSLITAVVALVVVVAMGIDLCSGLYKASLRGEKKTSFGLQRTTLKCITYLGSILICYGIDVLVHMGKLWEAIGWEWLIGVPVFALIIGVFNCAVELISVREKADSKADKRAFKQIMAIVKELRQSEATELVKALQEIANNNKKDEI